MSSRSTGGFALYENNIRELEKEAKNLRMLFVDDEASVCEYIRKIFERYFLVIDTAMSGSDALELYRQNSYDLIITDIEMPNMNGIEMCNEIKKINSDQAIVIMSAYSHDKYLLEGIRIGVDAYILKPVEIDMVIPTLLKVSKRVNDHKYSIEYRRHLEKNVEEQNSQICYINQKLQDAINYSSALDQSVIISRTDKDGVITYVSDKFCTVSGYSKVELIGSTHKIVRHPDMKSELFREMWKTITGKNIWQGRVKNRKKNGDYYIVNSIVIPMLDSNGEIEGYVSIRDDVTEIIKLEQKLVEERRERTNQELILKTKDALLTSFTHELMTPLNHILNFSKYLHKSIGVSQIENSQKLVGLTKMIQESGFAMLDMITNILELEKIKAGKVKFSSESFAPAEIVSDLLEARMETSNSIELHQEIKDNFRLHSDSKYFKCIVNNLLSNAFKYGKGIVYVGLSAKNGRFELVVEDNGDGIADKSSVFKLLSSADIDLSSVNKGVGAGLYLVKTLCDNLSYEIKIENSPKLGGARFVLSGQCKA